MAEWQVPLEESELCDKCDSLLAESNCWLKLNPLLYRYKWQDSLFKRKICTYAAVQAVVKGQLKVAQSLLQNVQVSDEQTTIEKKLLELTDFGARDLCCKEAVGVAASNRDWDLVEQLISSAESFAAKDDCRSDALEKLVSSMDRSTGGGKELDVLLKLLEAKRDAGVCDDWCLKAMKKVAKYGEEDVVLKLMDVAEAGSVAFGCFKTALKTAKGKQNSSEFVLQLLAKVKYCKEVISCYQEAVKFGFTDADGNERWLLISEVAKSARVNRIIKSTFDRAFDIDSEFEEESTQCDRRICWNWILSLILYIPTSRELSASTNRDLLMIALTEGIRRSKWSLVCQILPHLGTDYSNVHQREHQHPNSVYSFECTQPLLEALKCRNRILWAECYALLYCIAEEEFCKFVASELNNFVEILIDEECSQFYDHWDVARPLRIMQTLDRSEYKTNFLKCAYSYAKKKWCDLARKLLKVLKERGLNSGEAEPGGASCSCQICQRNRNADSLSDLRISTKIHKSSACTIDRRGLETYASSVSETRCTCSCKFKARTPILTRPILTLLTWPILNYEYKDCCLCECKCGQPDNCSPKLIKIAAKDHDWNSVLRVVQRHQQSAKTATDVYLQKMEVAFAGDVPHSDEEVGIHLKMIKLSAEQRNFQCTVDIINMSKNEYLKSEGFVISVNIALKLEEVDLAFSFMRAAKAASNSCVERCCSAAAERHPDKILKDERNYSEVKSLLQNSCQVFRDHMSVMRFKHIKLHSQCKSWHAEVTNDICTCGRGHLTRNSLCLLLWPTALSCGNWNFVVQLLQEMNSDKRNENCLRVLPQVIKNNQTRSACAILRCLSDKFTKKRIYFCSKTSHLIGKSETVPLLRSLIRLVTKKRTIEHCHFRAFVGALKTRNVSIILYVIRSEFRPDFTHPDILHFLANEALCGYFELVDLIFGELKRCTEIVNEADVQFRNECHDMIAAVLFKSMSEGHVALANAILKYADINYRTKDSEQAFELGTTLLIASAHCGHHELAGEILRMNAPVDEEDSKGRTALSWACMRGHLQIAKTLLDKGAKVLHKDRANETCLELAKIYCQSDVVKLLQHFGRNKVVSCDLSDEHLSRKLHEKLNAAGFTQPRAKKQQKMADFLQELVRNVTQEDWNLTGSYSDGVGNSMVQVNGRTSSDSDIDWTVILRPFNTDCDNEDENLKKAEKLKFHLLGQCKCKGTVHRLTVSDGHAETERPPGSQPASASSSCGIRPAQDICHAYACCSGYGQQRVRVLLPMASDEPVHLVTATGPNRSNEMRLSFSFREKEIMRRLTTVQGQFFVLIKFLFKRLLSKTWQTSGLKTYHARSCLFYMLERIRLSEDWKPEKLVSLLREALHVVLNGSFPNQDVFMKHFFMTDSYLYYKNAGIGGPFDATKQEIIQRLYDVLHDFSILETEFSKQLEPLHSPEFHFHPFALMPLIVPPEDFESLGKFARIYCLVFSCLRELQSDDWDMVEVLDLVETLPDCCKSARLCLKVMCYLKSANQDEAEYIISSEAQHSVLRRLSVDEIECLNDLEKDWLWRFCFVYYDQPEMKFLPKFSKSLICTKIPEKGAAHLYVNFRCLWWSFQVEIPGADRQTLSPDEWYSELCASPDSEDLEELQTLAHFSDNLIHVDFCAQKIGKLLEEKRLVPIEKEILDNVKQKQKEVRRDSMLLPLVIVSVRMLLFLFSP